MLLGRSPGGEASRLAQSGILLPGDFALFSGRMKAEIALSPAFPTNQYTISLSVESVGPKTFAPVHESRTNVSFVVNLGTASLAGLASVTWRAEPVH